jgi:progressive ankylosis protein
VRLFLFFPALAAITSWLRGLLINNKATRAINLGMAINLGVTAVILIAGVAAQLPGLPTAAVALNLASVAENIYLGRRAQLAVRPDFSLLGPVPVSNL